jgi:hypothetical protein
MLALQIAIGFGIAVLMPFLVYYATSSFFPQPVYPRSVPGEQNTFKVSRKDLDEYEQKRQRFQKRLFYVASTVGLFAVSIAPFLSVHTAGTGLMFGGVLSIVEGVGCCWGNFNPRMKFAFLLVAFAALLFIGYTRTSS